MIRTIIRCLTIGGTAGAFLSVGGINILYLNMGLGLLLFGIGCVIFLSACANLDKI